MAVIRRTTGQMRRGQTSALRAQNGFRNVRTNQKAPCVKGLARQRLRDCKGVEFAGKKKKIVCVRNNPFAALCAAPPLTQGRLIECAAGMRDRISYKREGKPLPYGFWMLVFAEPAGDQWSPLREIFAMFAHPKRPPPGGGSCVSGWGSTRDCGGFARWGNSSGCRTQSSVDGIQNKI